MRAEIEINGKSFAKKEVLKKISFAADGGNCIGILGANGCGKSTLLSILAGVQHGKGKFLLDGVDLMLNKKMHQKKIGYIPQGTPLIEELSAYDNLLLWYTKSEIESQLKGDGLMKRFGINEFLRVPVRKMSGGMKKRLSIVCSVANNPDVIIMDEPTAALDILCKQSIKNYISDCKKEGKIVILTTHEEQELKLCDTIYILKNGVLNLFCYNGNIDEVAEQIK